MPHSSSLSNECKSTQDARRDLITHLRRRAYVELAIDPPCWRAWGCPHRRRSRRRLRDRYGPSLPQSTTEPIRAPTAGSTSPSMPRRRRPSISCSTALRTLRRAYLCAVIDQVEVDDAEIRIIGVDLHSNLRLGRFG